MEQGRYRRARHPQGRCAGAGHAELPAPGLRDDAQQLRRRRQHGRLAGRGACTTLKQRAPSMIIYAHPERKKKKKKNT